jgi:flagellar basal-body rod protein FlgB
MSEIYLSTLAKDNSNWLSVRQSLIAGNVANANTPGFRSQDVKPMNESGNLFSNLARTNDGHLYSGIGNVSGVGTTSDDTWEVFHSGGNVSLPQEMMKAGEVAGAFQLNTAVMKSFHRMVVSVFGN